MKHNIITLFLFITTGCDSLERAQREGTRSRIEDIHKQVSDDAVKQYEIAKRGTDKMQTCVQAGFVVAAYLQAKDESNFTKWQEIERKDCAAAGLSR